MQGAMVLLGRGVETHIVDLDLAAAVRGQLPVAAGVARIQGREADQDAGIVGAASRDARCRIEREPIDLQHKVSEHLARVPERKSTRLNSSHVALSRMPSSA